MYPRTWGNLNPHKNTLDFKAGMKTPSQLYRRRFDTAGIYNYSVNGWAGGRVVVISERRVSLPVLRR